MCFIESWAEVVVVVVASAAVESLWLSASMALDTIGSSKPDVLPFSLTKCSTTATIDSLETEMTANAKLEPLSSSTSQISLEPRLKPKNFAIWFVVKADELA